jgi:hypothetical protein
MSHLNLVDWAKLLLNSRDKIVLHQYKLEEDKGSYSTEEKEMLDKLFFSISTELNGLISEFLNIFPKFSPFFKDKISTILPSIVEVYLPWKEGEYSPSVVQAFKSFEIQYNNWDAKYSSIIASFPYAISSFFFFFFSY